MNVKNVLLNARDCLAFLLNPTMSHWLKYNLDFEAMRKNSDKSLIITKNDKMFRKNNILIGAIFYESNEAKKIHS